MIRRGEEVSDIICLRVFVRTKVVAVHVIDDQEPIVGWTTETAI